MSPRTLAMCCLCFFSLAGCAGNMWQQTYRPYGPALAKRTPTVTLHAVNFDELVEMQDPPGKRRLGQSRFVVTHDSPSEKDLISFAQRIGATDVYMGGGYSHSENTQEIRRTPRDVVTRSTGTIRDDSGKEQRITLTNTTTHYDTHSVNVSYHYYRYLAIFFAPEATPALTTLNR
jgi:hypothetical protein